jgi:hypothetical protein
MRLIAERQGPLPVELIDHTSWIQLWLPCITAMIGSGVAEPDLPELAVAALCPS